LVTDKIGEGVKSMFILSMFVVFCRFLSLGLLSIARTKNAEQAIISVYGIGLLATLI
jgi:hypothetical protein